MPEPARGSPELSATKRGEADVQTRPVAAPRAAATGPSRGWAVGSETLAWLVLASAALVLVPLFLRMAVWGDCTLFDLAARSLLRRGSCYRELFIHGPPGMI